MDQTERGYIVHEGCDHIFFIGFLGAGKSTLARNLGSLFRRGFVDTDRMVERARGKSVCQIFEQDGEASFRLGELDALRSLMSKKSLLVSCGGGIVEGSESCELMHRMGTIVFLDGDFEDSLRQIVHPELRPDFVDISCAGRLYEQRRPLYEQVADIRIDIRNKNFDQVALEAAQLLWERGLL